MSAAHTLRTLRGMTLLLAAAAAACAPPPPPPGDAPLVVVTIFPVADLAARVAGEAARVETLLPPRASVHTWEATPAQVRAVAGAEGFISVGGGLDGWLEALADGPPGMRRLRLTDGVELLRADRDHAAEEHDHGEGGDQATGDPHVWLDPILVRDVLLPRITQLLVTLAPDAAGAIEVRSLALADSLTRLDEEIRATLGAVPGRDFLATHEAWAYFARRYDLRSLGSLYEGPGHEPSARGLARLVDAARAEGVGAVLAEPQMAETAARALAGEIGATVVVVDPLGGHGLTGRARYLDLMRFNAQAFLAALSAPPSP